MKPLNNIRCSKSKLRKLLIFKNGNKTCKIANHYSSKSLFMKHSQWKQKLKTSQEQPNLVCGHFIKLF